MASRLSLPPVYELWISSWQSALLAVSTATRNGLLTTKQAAAHTHLIAAERELVTKQLTLLLDH